MVSFLLNFTNQINDFLTNEVVDTNSYIHFLRNGITDAGNRVKWIGIVLRKAETGWNCFCLGECKPVNISINDNFP